MKDHCPNCGSDAVVSITPARPGPDGWGGRCKCCGHRWSEGLPKEEDVDLSMTTDRDGETDEGKAVPIGTTVEYLAHTPGGMVNVKLPDGSTAIMHPNCFPELR